MSPIRILIVAILSAVTLLAIIAPIMGWTGWAWPVCGALLLLLYMLVVVALWKPGKEKAEAFTSEKRPRSDEEFLAGCGLPDNDGARHVALGVRRVIAKLGKVEPQYIHHDAPFAGEINLLHFWDSLDQVEVVLTLEDELGVSIPNGQAEMIRDPEFDKTGLTVRDFVGDVYRTVASQITQDSTPRAENEDQASRDTAGDR